MKKIVLVLMVLLFIGLVNGQELNLSDELTSYFSFDVDASEDTGLCNDGTAVGASHDTVNSQLGGGSFNFNASTDNIFAPDNGVNGCNDLTENYTVNLWAYADGLTGEHILISKYPNDFPGDWNIHRLSSPNVRMNHAGYGAIGTGTDAPNQVWTMYTATGNSTHICFFQNATNKVCGTRSSSSGDVSANLEIGNRQLSASGWLGNIDEVAIYHRVISDAEISALYQNGSGCNPVETPTCGPSLIVNTDLVDNTINYNDPNLTINYNGTVVFTTDLFNCSLIVDAVTNQTEEVNVTNQQQFIYIFGDVEKDFGFELFCENSDTNATSGVFTYSVDTIVPRITETAGFVNDTQITKVIDRFVDLNVTYFDPNLFAYNRTLKDSGGVVINNVFVQNLNETNVTTVQNSTTFDADALNVDNYTHIHTVWDSHTAKAIKWSAVDIGNGFSYDSGQVWIYANGLTGYNAVKQTDRYTFEFTISGDPNNYKDIHLESKAPLIYLGSQYGFDNHFVSFTDNPKWIDFVSLDVADSIVTKVNDTHYIISVLSVSGNRFRFESIGDLNSRERSYTFEVLACPESWQQQFSVCTGEPETKVLTYSDANSCGTFNDLPANNGTTLECTFAETNPQTFSLLSVLAVIVSGAYILFAVTRVNRGVTREELMNLIALGIAIAFGVFLTLAVTS